MKALWLAPIHYNESQDLHPAPWISSLAKSLQCSGDVELTILNYQPDLPREKVVTIIEGIEYVFLKTPTPKIDYLTMYKKRISIMRSYVEGRLEEFDIIHIHGSEHQYEAMVHDLEIPVVMSMQGILSEYIKHIKNKKSYTYISWLLSSKYEKNYIGKVKDFMCRTSFDTGFVKKYNPDARVHEHWEMLRPSFFNDLYSTEQNYLLHMGGTNPLKGLSLMLQAFNSICTESPINLKLAGTVDPEIIEQIMLHHDLKNITADRFEILGMLNEEALAKAFQQSYMLVHPSLIDNSPNSICEAQVAGLPVVASEVGGVGSLIVNGESGILTSLDPGSITDGIRQLLNNKSLHRRLSKNGRELARKRHDAINIHNRTMDIYHSVLAA